MLAKTPELIVAASVDLRSGQDGHAKPQKRRWAMKGNEQVVAALNDTLRNAHSAFMQFAKHAALVHGGRRARISPWFVDHQAVRTDLGRPRSNMRLRTVTAIRVSTSWAGRVCERKVSPMMRLYRLIVPSTQALAL